MRQPPFRIKICGVRSLPDIAAVAASGADAVGFNFYSQSLRYVEPELAVDLSRAAATAQLVRVGLFVNSTPAEVASIAGAVELDVIQLHGDESISDVQAISRLGFPVLRAIRLPCGPLTIPVIENATVDILSAVPDAHLLIDADAGAAYGGSGRSLDWRTIGEWSRRASVVPQRVGASPSWVLAGGLRPDNVAVAIGQTGCLAVDVASGVEQPKGVKSSELIGLFAKNARSAFDRMPS